MLNRLDTRIAGLFLALLLLVQLAAFAVIREAIDRNARASIDGELETGGRVFLRLLEQHRQRMTESAQVLAADFGFRSTVASGDRATLTDALTNHGERIGASEMLFLDTDLNLQASTASLPPEVSMLARGLARDARQSESAQVVMIRGKPQLLLSVPIKAPLTVGWVVMGFMLDERLLVDLHKLSGIEASILVREGDDRWRVHLSHLPDDTAGQLAAKLPDILTQPNVRIGTLEYRSQVLSLVALPKVAVSVVLMRSLDAALAPFDRLQLLLLLITLAGAMLSGIASLATARRVTEPLKALTRSAERLSAGDYDAQVDIRGRDEVGDLARRFESMRLDIRERDLRISRLAYWDRLTGLPNRERFNQRLREAIARASGDHEPLAVLMLDLDRFKHVNDVLGPTFGDRLLTEVAVRLRSEPVRESDEVARFGGDEFAVLLCGANRAQAAEVARRIQGALERPITLDDHTVDLRAGIGAVCYPHDGEDAETLLRRVELAMYAAKARQNGFLFYDPGMDGSSEQSLSLLSELREAVEQNQLQLYLQPKVALDDGRIVGAEALVRWRHPVRGMVPPAQFIPFAEQTGAIRQVTHWMLENTLGALARLHQGDFRPKIAVNLSTRDLMDQHLPVKVARCLADNRLDPSYLCLEITESAIMDDPVRAEQTLHALHDMGLTLSIDDFGTGYSSLSYLKRLPVDQLKIDRSFVMNMEHDPADVKIVRSTIDLAHNLGLRVVAEGVETHEAWQLLRRLGCDEAQGYLIGRPMPATDFGAWAQAWRVPASLAFDRSAHAESAAPPASGPPGKAAAAVPAMAVKDSTPTAG